MTSLTASLKDHLDGNKIPPSHCDVKATYKARLLIKYLLAERVRLKHRTEEPWQASMASI